MSEAGRRALIFGVSGQDGSYLARLLAGKGYVVMGTSRADNPDPLANLRRIGMEAMPELLRVDPSNAVSVNDAIRVAAPDEIYYLAAQSSVGRSFEAPQETADSIVAGTRNVLEAARTSRPACRMYFASSGDCFGDTGDETANEDSPFRPASPYGTARCTAAAQVREYRASHGLHACNGFTFAHESPLRPAHFVTQKIATAAARIAAGLQQSLELGSLDIIRDWGWAPEYVDGMRLMLQQPRAADYVLATGRSIPLNALVESAFRHFGLDWRQCVTTAPALQRPSDIRASRADPSLAARELSWRTTVSAEQAMERMCEAASVKSA